MSKSKVPSHIPRSLVENVIDEYCHNEKYRNILKRRFLDELTFECIANEFDMSLRQIQNIVYTEGNKILDRLPF